MAKLIAKTANARFVETVEITVDHNFGEAQQKKTRQKA